jgi:hypothetical protein
MGIRFRLGLEGRKSLGNITSLGVSIKKAVDMFLPDSRESISKDMLVSKYLPYQASKTYKIIMTEYDCRRAHIKADVRQSLNHVS